METIVTSMNDRLSTFRGLRRQAERQAAERQRARIKSARNSRRWALNGRIAIRKQAERALLGAHNLCTLGRTVEMQSLFNEIGPIELWGWHLKQSDWSWECYIRLEKDRLAIVVTGETENQLQIYFDYAISDPLLFAYGKTRLFRIAHGGGQLDEEDWRMVEHEQRRYGFVQEYEPVLMQVLLDCATSEGLTRWLRL